jgi:hypothetical protein
VPFFFIELRRVPRSLEKAMKLTIKAAATVAGVCPAVVYGWVTDRLLPVYRLGGKGRRGKILIEDGDLNDFLRSRRVEAAGPAPAPAPRPRPIKLRHLRLPS